MSSTRPAAADPTRSFASPAGPARRRARARPKSCRYSPPSPKHSAWGCSSNTGGTGGRVRTPLAKAWSWRSPCRSRQVERRDGAGHQRQVLGNGAARTQPLQEEVRCAARERGAVRLGQKSTRTKRSACGQMASICATARSEPAHVSSHSWTTAILGRGPPARISSGSRPGFDMRSLAALLEGISRFLVAFEAARGQAVTSAARDEFYLSPRSRS
jgi:hypothetical protein